MDALDGNVALVTGAGSGIGRATALAFAAAGARVIVADIDPGGGAETVQHVHDADGEADFVQVDVTVGAEVEAKMAALHALGRLGTPEEAAQAVVWLCPNAASFVTGQVLTVDGGWTAQ